MEVSFELLPHFETGVAPIQSLQSISRKLANGQTVKIGRKVLKDGVPQTKESPHGLDIWFTSKVVSRFHSEMWTRDNVLYVRDVGSSSGTFLNKMRLSPSGKGSRAYPLKDGDVLQFGVDYKGKSEDIFKAVSFKISFTDKEYAQLRRKQANPVKFQTALRTLLDATNPYSSSPAQPENANAENGNSNSDSSEIIQPIECCICINTIAPYQALFISPCSHCFHYKCVSVILSQTTMFPCPMCRQVANLTASVSMESITCEDELGEESDVSVHVDEEGKEVGNMNIGLASSNNSGLNSSLVNSLRIDTMDVSRAHTPHANNGHSLLSPNSLASNMASPVISSVAGPSSPLRPTSPSSENKKSIASKISGFFQRKQTPHNIILSPNPPLVDSEIANGVPLSAQSLLLQLQQPENIQQPDYMQVDNEPEREREQGTASSTNFNQNTALEQDKAMIDATSLPETQEQNETRDNVQST